MFGSTKALVVVLVIAWVVLQLAKPLLVQFIDPQDFARRRLVWVVLTSVSFLSPNFWVYLIVAIPLLIWANRKDSNPVGLYLLLLHVVSPVGVNIPFLGNNGLFPLDNYRLLALCILLPTVLRPRENRSAGDSSTFGTMDSLLLAFGALQVVLYVAPDLPQHFIIPDSPSNMLRRAVLFVLDSYLVYVAVSRTCGSRRKLVDAAASFCIASGIMAGVAIFERAWGWLLYFDVARRWASDRGVGFYLSRGGSLRAQASSGHALALGFLLAIAFGFWLYFSPLAKGKVRRFLFPVLLWSGLFATYSRGPWLGGVAAYVTFQAAGSRAVTRLIKGGVIALIIVGIVLISPIGDQILDVLPVMGNAADGNIIYRQRLAQRGWEIVFANPLFGNQFPWPEMEDLRQGEGIIDIVNTYLGVALNYGLIGLFCFVSFILLAMVRVYRRARLLAPSEPEFAAYGTALVACIVATLIMIDSNSFTLGPEKFFYILAGLATAYVSAASHPSAIAEAGKRRQGR